MVGDDGVMPIEWRVSSLATPETDGCAVEWHWIVGKEQVVTKNLLIWSTMAAWSNPDTNKEYEVVWLFGFTTIVWHLACTVQADCLEHTIRHMQPSLELFCCTLSLSIFVW
jgi:hypothetical protein